MANFPSMNLSVLLKDWLIGEMDFAPTQVSLKRMPDPDEWQIIVFLSGTKLHFVISGFLVDCALMNGGEAIRIDVENYLCQIHGPIDLRDPQSLNIIADKIKSFRHENP